MKVLQHVVFFKLTKKKLTPNDWKAIQEAGAECAKLKGIISYSLGPALFPYKDYADRTQGFTHMLIVTFIDVASMKHYMDHDKHTQFKKVVGPFSNGIAVIDTWQDNFPEFALYGHTMASPAGPADARPGGFVSK